MTQLPFRKPNRFGILFRIKKPLHLFQQLKALHDFEEVADRDAVGSLFQGSKCRRGYIGQRR